MGGGNLAETKDKPLLNPYGVLAVNPDKHPNVKAELAQKFVEWILSPDVQKMIGEFGTDKYGQPLFYANAQPAEAAGGEKAAAATGDAALKVTRSARNRHGPKSRSKRCPRLTSSRPTAKVRKTRIPASS